jgi:hypothetical protein
MRLSAQRVLIATLFLLATRLVAAEAQTQYPNVKVTGRLQEQFYYFDNSDYASSVGPEDNIFVRRARIEARGNISENVVLFIQPSYEGGRTTNSTTTCTSTEVPAGGGTPTITCRTSSRGGIRLRDAWIDVRLGNEANKTDFYIRAGQEKRPMSRYELTSSVNLPSIERGAGGGLIPRASNDLFVAAGFLAHDVGASARVEHQLDDVRLLTLKVGVYNGQGESVNDVNNKKSFGARGTFGVTDKLDVGASWFAHDGITTVNGVPDSTFTNYAWGVDGSWGKPGDEGLYALAEYLDGNDPSPAKLHMRGMQFVGAYNIRMSSPTSWLYAVEPLFRLDFADPNTDADDDGQVLLTAGVGVYLSSKTWFRVAYEQEEFQGDAPSISGIRSMLGVSF